jgi:hypothetical protein
MWGHPRKVVSSCQIVRSCLNERKYEKNEEKTEKLREIGVGCLLSSAVGKSKNLKGKGGESSNARTFRRDKGFAYISAKIE